jgi:hypothetical protein
MVQPQVTVSGAASPTPLATPAGTQPTPLSSAGPFLINLTSTSRQRPEPARDLTLYPTKEARSYAERNGSSVGAAAHVRAFLRPRSGLGLLGLSTRIYRRGNALIKKSVTPIIRPIARDAKQFRLAALKRATGFTPARFSLDGLSFRSRH